MFFIISGKSYEIIFFIYLFQFRNQIRRGLQKTPCCKHRIKTASRQRDDNVIDKTHHQMYASTASITHNNGIQLSLEQTLAPSSANSGSSGSGSTSSTGTASSGDQLPLTNSKVGTPIANGLPNGGQSGPLPHGAHLNNAFYLNNLRNTSNQPQLPPPYVNQFNRFHYPASMPASLPASVRATPTADFELYPRHLRTNSYTQATQQHIPQHQQIPQQIYNPVQSTPLHRRYNNNQNNNNAVQQQNFQLRHFRSDSCNSILSHDQLPTVHQQYEQQQQQQQSQLQQQPGSNMGSSNTRQQLLYDKLHGRQSSSSAG